MAGDPRDYVICPRCGQYLPDLTYHACGTYSLHDATAERLSKIEEILEKILAILEKSTDETGEDY